jgi:CysZ protein
MLNAARLSFRQIFSAPFRGVLLKSVGLTLLLLAAAFAAAYWLFTSFVSTPWPWLETVINVIAGAGLVVGLVFLVAPVTALFAGLFLDDIAEAVERRWYPGDPPGRPLPLREAVPAALRFTGIVILVNILLLFLLLLPGINLVAFFVANGYLLGREYFELAASRFHPREEVARLREKHRGRVFFGGALIALLLVVPFANLLTPLFATAFMVHIHKRVMGTRPREALP